jgi:hypothetical protein
LGSFGSLASAAPAARVDTAATPSALEVSTLLKKFRLGRVVFGAVSDILPFVVKTQIQLAKKSAYKLIYADNVAKV